MDNQALEELINRLSEGFEKLSSRKMFGCHALFANGKIFALVWKEARVGVKLLETADYESALALPGAIRWSPGSMKVKSWVLVPKAFHNDGKTLKSWLKKAHAQALSAPAKPNKPTRAGRRPSSAPSGSKPKSARGPKAPRRST